VMRGRHFNIYVPIILILNYLEDPFKFYVANKNACFTFLCTYTIKVGSDKYFASYASDTHTNTCRPLCKSLLITCILIETNIEVDRELFGKISPKRV
jgi:hypothetical protein